MDGARDTLLSRARLAENQHSDVGIASNAQHVLLQPANLL